MSRQTHWTVDSPQGLEGMQKHYWKGDHPFFFPFCSSSDPVWDPLWAEVPFDFVRRLVLLWRLDIRLDCGSAGTGLYVTPDSGLVFVEFEEEG